MSIQSAFNCPSAWTSAACDYKQAVDKIGDVNCIVEIGVDFGYSLFTMARDYPNAVVIGFDPYGLYGHAEQAKAHVFKHLPYFPNARVELMFSADAYKIWRDPSVYMDIDVLHIDGDHSYDGVKSDFNIWVPAVRPGGIVMFHDVNSFRDDVGRFFNELPGEKTVLDVNGAGLGIWTKDA